MRERDPKDMVRGVLEPDEELLWYGAPNVEAAMSRRRRSGLLSFMALFAAIFGIAYFQAQQGGMSALETIRAVLDANPMMLYGLAGVFAFTVILRALGFDNRSRLRRHFAQQAYGLTDRRVIVIEGKSVTSFAGDELDQPRVRARAEGYDDVVFGTRRVTSSGEGRTRDPVVLERATIGFKALENAEEMKSLLEAWIANELRESAETVTDFVESQVDSDSAGVSSGAGTATVRHDHTGMTIEYPDEWSMQVRKKKKPFGKTFFDREKWGSPVDVPDWNYVRLEGPVGCSVDAEVFETPLLAEYDSLANSRLASLAGELLDADPMVEQHGMRGFTVARRSPLQANAATRSAGAASVVTPFRHTVFHDGRYQLTITSKWPERSPELAEAVDLVVRSVRLA